MMKAAAIAALSATVVSAQNRGQFRASCDDFSYTFGQDPVQALADLDDFATDYFNVTGDPLVVPCMDGYTGDLCQGPDEVKLLTLACNLPAVLPPTADDDSFSNAQLYQQFTQGQVVDGFFDTNIWSGSSIKYNMPDGSAYTYADINAMGGFFTAKTRYCDPAVSGADCLENMAAYTYDVCSTEDFPSSNTQQANGPQTLLCSQNQCCEGYDCKYPITDVSAGGVSTDPPYYGGDASDCIGKVSGEFCTVTCPAGYVALKEAPSFQLLCNTDGYFMAPDWTDTDVMSCVPTPCDIDGYVGNTTSNEGGVVHGAPGPAAMNVGGPGVVYDFYHDIHAIINGRPDKVPEPIGTGQRGWAAAPGAPDIGSGDKFVTYCDAGYTVDTSNPAFQPFGDLVAFADEVTLTSDPLFIPEPSVELAVQRIRVKHTSISSDASTQSRLILDYFYEACYNRENPNRQIPYELSILTNFDVNGTTSSHISNLTYALPAVRVYNAEGVHLFSASSYSNNETIPYLFVHDVQVEPRLFFNQKLYVLHKTCGHWSTLTCATDGSFDATPLVSCSPSTCTSPGFGDIDVTKVMQNYSDDREAHLDLKVGYNDSIIVDSFMRRNPHFSRAQTLLVKQYAAGLDYSDCTGKVTGQTCSLSCAAGYSPMYGSISCNNTGGGGLTRRRRALADGTVDGNGESVEDYVEPFCELASGTVISHAWSPITLSCDSSTGYFGIDGGFGAARQFFSKDNETGSDADLVDNFPKTSIAMCIPNMCSNGPYSRTKFTTMGASGEYAVTGFSMADQTTADCEDGSLRFGSNNATSSCLYGGYDESSMYYLQNGRNMSETDTSNWTIATVTNAAVPLKPVEVVCSAGFTPSCDDDSACTSINTEKTSLLCDAAGNAVVDPVLTCTPNTCEEVFDWGTLVNGLYDNPDPEFIYMLNAKATGYTKVDEIRSTLGRFDYSSCIGKVSGQVCTPSCREGYVQIAPAIPFTLQCFHATPLGTVPDNCLNAADLTDCAPALNLTGSDDFNSFVIDNSALYAGVGNIIDPSNWPYNFSNNAERGNVYASSDASSAGILTDRDNGSPYEMVKPDVSPVFTFDYSQNSQTGTMGQGLQCEPAICDPTKVVKMVEWADYSDCVGKATGATCEVSCLDSDFVHAGALGDESAAAAASYTNTLRLTCGDNMDWTDFEEDFTIKCTPNICTDDSVAKAQEPLKDYSSCIGMVSGQVCSPSCIGGTDTTIRDASNAGALFASPDPDGFILGCSANGTFQSQSVHDFVDVIGPAQGCPGNPVCVPGQDNTAYTDTLECVANTCDAPSNPAGGGLAYNIPKLIPFDSGGATNFNFTYDGQVAGPFDLTTAFLNGFSIRNDTSNLISGRGPHGGEEFLCIQTIRDQDASWKGGITAARQTSGDTCNPECPFLFTNPEADGGRSSDETFVLACNNDGSFQDTLSAGEADVCNPGVAMNAARLSCVNPGVGSSDCSEEVGWTADQLSYTSNRNLTTGNDLSNIDYSDCVGKMTGERCTPSCAAGFTQRRKPKEFVIFAIETAFASVDGNPSNGDSGDESYLARQLGYDTIGGFPLSPSGPPTTPYENLRVYLAAIILLMQDEAVFNHRGDSGSGVSDYEVAVNVSLNVADVYIYALVEGDSVDKRGFFYDFSGIECIEAVCDGAKVTHPPGFERANVDYSDCNGVLSGSNCEPSCADGYSEWPEGSSFDDITVLCNSDGSFVDETIWGTEQNIMYAESNTPLTEPDPSDLALFGQTVQYCAPNECLMLDSGSAANELYDYSSCSRTATAGFSGKTCFPECIEGYKASINSAPTGFVLNCDANGLFRANEFNNMETGLVCIPEGTVEAEAKIAEPEATAAPVAVANSGKDSGANSGKDSGANSGKDSGANSGKDSGANSGKNSGANSGKNSGANSGKNSGANSGKNSGANSGRNSGKGGSNRAGTASRLSAAARGSAAKNPVAYAASGVGVVILAAIVIAAATRYGLRSDAATIEEGLPLNELGVHPIYA